MRNEAAAVRSRGFYSRLAIRGMVKNGRFYLPYIITCAATAAMFYILCFLTFDDYTSSMPGAGSLIAMLVLGCIVVAIFSAVILLYANSFLMKRRRKELGLYSVLGMEKRHISRLLARETLFSGIFSLAVGLAVGILLSKLIQLGLVALLRFEVRMGFSVSVTAILITCAVFAVIFIITLISNLVRTGKSRPIELLRGGEVGEREPRTKWLLAVLGLLTLGAGYYLANTVESPLAALALFFVAVLLVILGTYCLFTAGSIAVLKLLRRNKRYYYQTKRFISISGMLYRMKRNAVGLASICILSTMVLVTVSTTLSLYVGVESSLDSMYPYDMYFSVEPETDGVDKDAVREAVRSSAEDFGLPIVRQIEFESLSFSVMHNGNAYELMSPDMEMDAIGVNAAKNVAWMSLMSLDEYNRVTGKTVALASDESLACGVVAGTITVGGLELRVTAADDIPMLSSNTYYAEEAALLVVPDDVLEELYHRQSEISGDQRSEIRWRLSYDLEGSDEEVVACCDSAADRVANAGGSFSFGCRRAAGEDFYAVYGGFLFLGLFLGLLFLLATALIIYYKQLSEGYDDRERFAIMSQVGLSDKEARSCVKSQILTVFFLPLAAAAIHVVAAFDMISKLLGLFNLTDIGLFGLCCAITALGFGVVYCIIYTLTARAYYRIVRA